MKYLACVVVMLASLATASAQSQPASSPAFQVSSKTFTNGSQLPISAINNNIVNGVNTCSADGSPAGNESPELSWTNAQKGKASFVVVLYDVTASFTHWGMYNIPATTTELPEGAGVAGSKFGAQVFNDFFAGEEYDGPCPPPNAFPFVHHYVFTVYALDEQLHLPALQNFPPVAETLYQALFRAGRFGHVLSIASITGLYSTHPRPTALEVAGIASQSK